MTRVDPVAAERERVLREFEALACDLDDATANIVEDGPYCRGRRVALRDAARLIAERAVKLRGGGT